MLGDVHKAFGRDFLIAFFLPTIAYLVATIALFHQWNALPQWVGMPLDVVQRTASIALVACACSLVLMAFNRLLVRALEGYWPIVERSRVNWLEVRRFKRLTKRIADLRAARETARSNDRPFTHRRLYNDLSRRMAESFPRSDALVLPTAFGNTMRAFEDYPRIMYGFESIHGWRRLETVIPRSYQESLGAMRALMDFWVNIWFLSIVFLVQSVAIRGWTTALADWWLLVLLLPVPFLAAWRATLAAGQWGELVKSSFDVFLPALADKLGYARPSTIARERELWRAFSRAIVFRDPESLADIDPFRITAQTRPSVLSSEDLAADQD